MTDAPTKRWWALLVLTLPVLIISMDATILGFAVPKLSAALEPTSSQLLWIIDIYSFVLAGLLVTMGVAGDRIGRRRILMLGSAGFSVASVLAAFAPNAGALMAARALLGIAGATLLPSTLSLIRNIFTDARQRQVAIAVWATAFAVGSAIGPIVGGFLLEHFWWGSVFLVGVPFVATLLLVAPKLVPESKDPNPAPFDFASALLSMAAMFPIVYAIKMFAEHGIRTVAIAALILGVVALLAFVRRQRRLADPMIDVNLFRLPRFRMAIVGNLIACVGFAGSLYFVTQFLQLVLGLSPLEAGVRMLPSVGASIVFTLMAPFVARRIGAFAVVGCGLILGTIGFTLLSRTGVDSSAAQVVFAVVVLNAGLGSAMTVAVDAILTSVPPERAGAGASVSETGAELGMALGTAVLGSIATAVYRGQIDEVAVQPPITEEVLGHARETLGAAVNVAGNLDDSAAAVLRGAAQSAFVSGMSVAMIVAAAVMAPVAIWAFAVRRHPAAAVAAVH